MTDPVPEGSLGHIRLPDTLNLAQARTLADRIGASRGLPLTIDASAVRHLGAQCAQVLVAAGVAWRAEGCAFAIVDRSAPFTNGLRLLGLADHLQG